jgi:PLAT/LH2 domain
VQVDVFEIEAVDLQNVTKVIIGHDGNESGEGWYLEKVVVSVNDDTDTTRSWTFECQRYVSSLGLVREVVGHYAEATI